MIESIEESVVYTFVCLIFSNDIHIKRKFQQQFKNHLARKNNHIGSMLGHRQL